MKARQIVVNLHGALISTSITLNEGMKITIYVHLTGKRASAEVVYADPDVPLRCGIALASTEHLGNTFPPEDWFEANLE